MSTLSPDTAARHVRFLTLRHAAGSSIPRDSGLWPLKRLEERIRRKEDIDVDFRTARPPTSTLLADGRLKRFRAGNRTLYTSGEVATMNLRELRDRAEDHIDPDYSPCRGRRTTTDGDRRVEVINERHHRRIVRTCRKIGRHLGGTDDEAAVERALERIDLGHEFFVWDPDGGVGAQGDWCAAVKLTRTAVASQVSQHVGNIRRLLDLGATHGYIPRSERHTDDFRPIPPRMADLYNRWRNTLSGEIDQLRKGLLGLFEACTAQGMEPDRMEADDWKGLIDHLEASWKTTETSSRTRSVIRKTYRALRRHSLLTGPDWDPQARRMERARALFSKTTIRAVADLHGREGARRGIEMALQGEAQDWPGFEDCQGLLPGPYGLRRMVLHYTAKGRERRQLGLYARGKYPRHRVRPASPRRPRAWRKATIREALAQISQVTGWIARHRDVDWNEPENDLRVLLQRDHLEAYYDARDRDPEISAGTLERQFTHLARIASPYLEKVALEAGDEALADRLLSISRLISAPRNGVAVPESDDGRSWIEELRDHESEAGLTGLERQRRKAELVERVWTNGKRAAEFAHIQHWRVLEAYLARLEERFGPITRQIEALQASRDRVEGENGQAYEELGHTWAERTRDAMLWADQVVVPLRPHTITLLAVEDRKHDEGCRHVTGKVPGWKFKAGIRGGVFDPIYTREKCSDNSYARDLYRLYVMAGGVRERLLTRPDGSVWTAAPVRDDPDHPFYVHSVRRTDDPQITVVTQPRIFARVAERALEYDPDALNGVTYEQLAAPDGLLAAHQFRHALGTILVAHDNVVAAATYLQHSSWDMLRDVYAAVSASHFDVPSTLADIRRKYG